MNKEGVHIPAESGRKMNLKNRERGGQKQKEKWGRGDKNIAEMSLICLLYNGGQSRDRNHDTR
jgi:hypothetical protein